jgi:hypothetical protein
MPGKEILRRRLETQRISATSFTKPAEIVAWLGAVQAQDYLGALWAVGVRLVDAHERDVERAIAERAIVRSWPMRGTLHFLAAADARWMIDLLAPRAATAATSRLKRMGIDAPLLSRARRALVKELEGGRMLTRPAAYAVLERARIATKDQRGLHVLWCLAHEGLVCFGPREGKQQTFVLLEEWLPRAKLLPREEGLATVARRYFAGHGPATLRDFAWWSGLNLTEARRGIDVAGKVIAEETIGDERYWCARSPAGKARGERAFVLPPFDELLVGYADRSAALDPAHADRITPFEMLGPVIILDERLAATWKRRIAGRKVTFSTSPLTPLDKTKTSAMKHALDRYARFLELDPA